MKEEYFKYIFPKKLRKENIKKKIIINIKRTSKRNALVLRTFKYEKTSEIETKRQRKIFEVSVFYFQR